MKKKLRVIALGGLNEVGKNLTVYEYGRDMIVVDCGLKFPDDSMPGVEFVIPDMTYLIENKARLKGLIITHGHEDHIGALPYLYRDLACPIYTGKLTAGLIAKKLEEHSGINTPKMHIIDGDSSIKLGGFTIDFIRVTHSIPDSFALAIHTDLGSILHTGDFKVDFTPIDQRPIDLQKLAEIGSKGVLLLLADSTNADRPGFTLSEATVGTTLENIFFAAEEGRIIVSSFSSNVHRIQQVVNAAHLAGRKVALTGRSMLSTIGVAEDLGYINVPEEIKLDIEDINSYPDNEVCIITTGSQGEKLAGLSRIASGTHPHVQLRSGDTVVLSSSAIPGNEKSVFNVINKLYAKGANVIYSELADVHVSGHARREELKLMHSLIKPKYFLPIHGEYAHLMRHIEIAEELGLSSSRCFVMENGDVLEYDGKDFSKLSKVQVGEVLIDGSAHSDIGEKVIKERQLMASEGLVCINICLNAENDLVYPISLASRGFITTEGETELFKMAETRITDRIRTLKSSPDVEIDKLRQQMTNSLNELFFKTTRRRPLILLNLIRLD